MDLKDQYLAREFNGMIKLRLWLICLLDCIYKKHSLRLDNVWTRLNYIDFERDWNELRDW